ncbi:MAG: DUF6941 family protein [bacterium]|jgi:hypothetical protein
MANEHAGYEIAFPTGPYLVAALICERVLEEKDGTKSAIRIVDRLTRTTTGPNPPKEMMAFEYEFSMLVRFKAGDARGPMTLQIEPVKPSSETLRSMIGTVHFEGEEDRGVDVVVNFKVKVEQAGVYWFNVYLDNIRMTRVPLRVVYTRQVTPPEPQSGG